MNTTATKTTNSNTGKAIDLQCGNSNEGTPILYFKKQLTQDFSLLSQWSMGDDEELLIVPDSPDFFHFKFPSIRKLVDQEKATQASTGVKCSSRSI